jgi:hypothetical protein
MKITWRQKVLSLAKTLGIGLPVCYAITQLVGLLHLPKLTTALVNLVLCVPTGFLIGVAIGRWDYSRWLKAHDAEQEQQKQDDLGQDSMAEPKGPPA